MRKGLKFLKFAAFALIAIPLFGFVIMWLWNWLVPTVFGWHTINFWQGLGLFLLSRLLFGGMHGSHRPHYRWRRRMMESWQKMTPEERETFRDAMRARCCPVSPPASKERVSD